LVMGYFGTRYKIFMVFVLMVAHNIRSIEQLKNLNGREGGIMLGISRLPTRLKARHWLHEACRMNVSTPLLTHFFRSQLQGGIVGIWLWFTDGHHLPYTGQRKLHAGYNTQRRMPEPARTNLVTSDSSGRIVDFEIQEGKGDLRRYIVRLAQKWQDHLDHTPVMIFDREGHGAAFFHNLLDKQIPFVTWEKHIDTKKLEALDGKCFGEQFEFNDKVYRVFEGEKTFTHTPENGTCQEFTLRRIYIWNVSSDRRTCALAGISPGRMSTQDCARAILNRWGASENTFKHLADRHPLHYQPGYSFCESEKQEIANKAIPERTDISLLEDYRCFQRLSNESKNLFDFVTSCVWNVRKQMVEWLLPFYENKNEYIDLFYAITHCQGWIKSEKHKVTMRLEPLRQPSRRAAQEQFCRKLTSLNATTPTGKSLVIEVGRSPLK
jgi:hypothetical protein